jgi:putative nucleotidyltransferase with HDIG domain
MFRSEDRIGGYTRRGLWEHSVAVGVAAKMVCRRFSAGAPEEGFVAGLVHDIGMILEDQYVHDAFEKAVLTSEEKHLPLWKVEQAILGTDHADMGRQLALRWRFPDAIAQAVGGHHQPSQRRDPGKLGRVLHVADVIAYSKHVGYASGVTATPDLDGFKSLGLSRNDVVVLFEDLDEDLQKAKAFFEI